MIETDLVIRPATPRDCNIIVEFNLQLAMESEGHELDRQVLASGVAQALGHSDYCRYFVAEINGQVIGQTMITYEWSDWNNGIIWWIQSVYIHPDCRRQGYFRRIFQWIADQARMDPAVIGLRLYVDQSNQKAMQTYESLGMYRLNYLMYETMFKQGKQP